MNQQKMFRIIGVFICFISINYFIGCNQTSDQTYLQHQNDSLKIIIQKDSLYIDSLQAIHKETKRWIVITAKQCQFYAKTVKENPSQSVFIVAWINRAFADTNNMK